MTLLEKNILAEIAKREKLSLSKLGLRFDKVVVQVLAALHEVDFKTANTTILVAITAPIRLPAQSTVALKQVVEEFADAKARWQHKTMTINRNDVRICRVQHKNISAPKIFGFVHNRSADPQVIFQLIENWLDTNSP